MRVKMFILVKLVVYIMQLHYKMNSFTRILHGLGHLVYLEHLI